jgi:hypothetical protein
MTVEEAIKTLRENGYAIHLIFDPLSAENAIINAAESHGKYLSIANRKELTAKLFDCVNWSYYEAEINDDLIREADNLLEVYEPKMLFEESTE